MPKYLFQASYTVEGTKGLLKEGGSKRKAAADEAVKSAGGKMEAFYYAFGEADVYLIVDLPDNATAAATSLAINATGAVAIRTTVLLTAEEMDQVSRKKVGYRAPGS